MNRSRFVGWRMVALSALMLGLTGPGQTVGISVFVDPMMATLGLTRSQVSTAYFIGTLAGAFALPRIGRALDDHGTRATLTAIAFGFSAALAAMAGVRGFVTLALGLVGIRMLGQGALSLVATNAVAPWFERRRGLAIGVVTAVGSSVIALQPLVTNVVITRIGWRGTWLFMAGTVGVLLLVIARRGIIDRPEDIGQRRDGLRIEPIAGAPAGVPIPAGRAPEQQAATGSTARDFTRAEALRTPMFWALSGGTVATGMLTTAMAFHQIDLLGEQGLTSVQAAANFLPQTVATFSTVLLVGTLVDHIAPRWILLASMLLLAAAMLAVPAVAPGPSAVAYGMALGASGAAARSLEAGAFPRLYGVRHLGAIRGAVTGIGVASTALGPIALAVGRAMTGSYVGVLRGLIVIPALVAVLGVFAPPPRRVVAEPGAGR
jgi:MFS family permease